MIITETQIAIQRSSSWATNYTHTYIKLTFVSVVLIFFCTFPSVSCRSGFNWDEKRFKLSSGVCHHFGARCQIVIISKQVECSSESLKVQMQISKLLVGSAPEQQHLLVDSHHRSLETHMSKCPKQTLSRVVNCPTR